MAVVNRQPGAHKGGIGELEGVRRNNGHPTWVSSLTPWCVKYLKSAFCGWNGAPLLAICCAQRFRSNAVGFMHRNLQTAEIRKFMKSQLVIYTSFPLLFTTTIVFPENLRKMNFRDLIPDPRRHFPEMRCWTKTTTNTRTCTCILAPLQG